MRRRFRRSTSDPTPDPKSDEIASSDDPDPSDGGAGDRAPAQGGGAADFDALLARQLDRADEVADEVGGEVAELVGGQSGRDDEHEVGDPEPMPAIEATAAGPEPSVEPVDRTPTRAANPSPDPGDFWDHYDQASAEAELTVVPPAAVAAVVGPLEAALPVIRRCRDRHWMGDCDVFVLTQQPLARLQGEGESPWTAVTQPSDLVAVLDEGGCDFPLLVLDVPQDLPSFVRPLVARLRDGGVGLVHYVLDGEPVDEDLATWHGELGRPSVLDLAGPVPADRVLELVDRGEPVVSVAGRDLSAELLLALRIERRRRPVLDQI